MRTRIDDDSFTLWLSASDTDDWRCAHPASWPCSTINGRPIMVQFDANGLLDFTVSSKNAPDDIDGNELSAMVADVMATRLPRTHPAYFVAVEQFRTV